MGDPPGLPGHCARQPTARLNQLWDVLRRFLAHPEDQARALNQGPGLPLT